MASRSVLAASFLEVPFGDLKTVRTQLFAFAGQISRSAARAGDEFTPDASVAAPKIATRFKKSRRLSAYSDVAVVVVFVLLSERMMLVLTTNPRETVTELSNVAKMHVIA